jgi:hypothetical protein
MTSNIFTQLGGGLVFAEKWELNVIHTSKADRFKAAVKIDKLRLYGSIGEPEFGKPKDFNMVEAVIDVLADPKRRS